MRFTSHAKAIMTQTTVPPSRSQSRQIGSSLKFMDSIVQQPPLGLRVTKTTVRFLSAGAILATAVRVSSDLPSRRNEPVEAGRFQPFQPRTPNHTSTQVSLHIFACRPQARISRYQSLSKSLTLNPLPSPPQLLRPESRVSEATVASWSSLSRIAASIDGSSGSDFRTKVESDGRLVSECCR